MSHKFDELKIRSLAATLLQTGSLIFCSKICQTMLKRQNSDIFQFLTTWVPNFFSDLTKNKIHRVELLLTPTGSVTMKLVVILNEGIGFGATNGVFRGKIQIDRQCQLPAKHHSTGDRHQLVYRLSEKTR